MKVKYAAVVSLFLFLLVGASCAAAKTPTAESGIPAEYRSLRILGASLGSGTTTGAIAYAALFTKFYPEIEWSGSSGGGSTNVVYLTKGTIKLARVQASHYLEAYGFDKVSESRVRSLNLPVAPEHYFFLVPEDKPWKDISEVPKGANLHPGAAGTTVPVATEAWLSLAGLTKKDFNWLPMSKAELADAWRNSKVDVAMVTVSSLAPWLMDMYTSPRKFKVMGLSPQQEAKAKAEQTFERMGFGAPATGTLSQIVPEIFKTDFVCPQAPNFLTSRDDFPDEIAYNMAKVLDERHNDFVQIFPATKFGATPQHHIKWARPPLDIHPGVAKYYREKGYLK